MMSTYKKIILVDTSGSMSEDGKDSVVKNVIYSIQNLLYDYSEEACDIYLWNEDIIKFSGIMSFNGGTSCDKIDEFLKEHLDEHFLIIGDGCYDRRIQESFEKECERLYFLIIGSNDELMLGLKRKIQNRHLYRAENVANCIKFFMQA